MSHFSVMVVGDDVEGQLAPFHEFECTGLDDQYVQDVDITNDAREEYEKRKESYPTFAAFVEEWHGKKPVTFGSKPDLAGPHKYGYYYLGEGEEVAVVIDRTNPNKQWDWWVVGGRFSGKLLHTDGSWRDSLIKSHLDLSGMRESAARSASEHFSKFERLTAGCPMAESWESIRGRHESIDEARAAYNAQPMVQAVKGDHDYIFSGIGEYLVGVEKYIESAEDSAGVTFALVKDGKWFQRGEMGWWGVVRDEKDKGDWNKEFHTLLNGLDGQTLLTVVDCHI